ncbi:hypothetical protein WR25_11852 [Diploscapter pachys]|uniref:Uncharacterized protein n=1 Tax=Diploscapter pachys TaxID=2018661 RepID=A0A2A2L1Z6_9BILA|nr:hypothetical protein WR25_11852 [Diploscapter pachys]
MKTSNIPSKNSRRPRISRLCLLNKTKDDENSSNVKNLENQLRKLKIDQNNRIKNLQDRLRSLLLHHKNLSGGQIDAKLDGLPPEDPSSLPNGNRTAEDIGRQKTAEILHHPEELLKAFIYELEAEKLNIQKDIRLGILRMEQRLKEEAEIKFRVMNDAHERQIEKLNFIQMEKLRDVEAKYEIERTELLAKIEYLTDEVDTLREFRDQLSLDLSEARDKLIFQSDTVARSEIKRSEMAKELSELKNYKEKFQKDMRMLESLRRDLTRTKEANHNAKDQLIRVINERDELLLEVERLHQQLVESNKQLYEKVRDALSQD